VERARPRRRGRSAAASLQAVLTAHGFFSPVAIHGWWAVPRFAMLVPLLPVLDINVSAPDGELIGNAFTLSRVLTVTDLLMIMTQGDATMRRTNTVSEDFGVACTWYAGAAAVFATICLLGSLLRRNSFNALFSSVGIVLIMWELVVCGAYWPLLGALLAATLCDPDGRTISKSD